MRGAIAGNNILFSMLCEKTLVFHAFKMHMNLRFALLTGLFAGRALAAACIAHVEAPVTDLLGGVEEQGRVGLLAF